MGATGSRSSSPPTETLLVTIPEYSKLVRVPGREQTLGEIFFRDLTWDVKVKVSAEEGDVADYLLVSIRPRDPAPAVGMDMSIEILDETGEQTVFHRESSRGTWEETHGCLRLGVQRSELEASSCVRRGDDSLTIRCTLKEQPKGRRRLRGNWPSSKSKKQLPAVAEAEVALAASHTLTVGSLSELKAALPSHRCSYSTRFAVGGSRWYLTLHPTPGFVHLFRATKEGDETQTTAEFSFALQGAVNVESRKMRHTFDRANSYYEFSYQPPEEPGTSLTDRLVVRCCVQVIPATAIPTAIPPLHTESALTPLLKTSIVDT